MKPKSEYVQCDLVSLDRPGTRTTMWLNRPGDFRVGSVVSLRGETEKWKVLRKGADRRPKESLNKEWAVGGLSKRSKT
jgi:hypothetical protein